MTEKEIFEKAFMKNGVEAQLDMVSEECGELITAVNKLKRNGFIGCFHAVDKLNDDHTFKQRMAYFNICSEVADVRIMLKQLELMLDKDIIDLSEERKLTRLRKRLEI